jgi:uncharacterized delta-60 repeat protein
VALQPDGKILVGGYFTNLAGLPENGIGRLNADGTADTSFFLGQLGFQVESAGSGPGSGVAQSAAPNPTGRCGSGLAQSFTPKIVGDDWTPPGIVPPNLPPDYVPSFVYALAVQPDGKILAGGWFARPHYPSPQLTIARLNANGSWDSGLSQAVGTNQWVFSLVLQPDGKILAGGTFTNLAGQARYGLGRLNANGTLDTGFQPAVGGSYPFVYPIALQSDGRIVVGGCFTNLNGQLRKGIARLNGDGTLDSAFNPGTDGPVYALALQADGKILVAGNFRTLGGQPRAGLGRLNADGTLDSGFDPGVGGNYPYVFTLAVQANGKILAGGTFASLGGQARNGLARINADGTPDLCLNANPDGPVYALVPQPDGKVLAAGPFSTLGLGGGGGYVIGRLNTPDLAAQSLAFDGSTITWLRGGGSPEAKRTTFDYSVNGVDWASLGAGTRITGGWQSSGVSVPPDATIRARAFVTGGLCDGSSGLVENMLSLSQTPPIILTDDGNFGFRTNEFGFKQFGFNLVGMAGQTVVIEASTNLVNWFPLVTNTLGAGPLYFSDPDSTNFAARFYRARLQ